MSWPVMSRFSRRIWIGWTVVVATRAAVDLARLGQQAVLEVREAAALAEPGALEVHGHRAGEHEVELGHLVQVDHLAVLERALDRGGLAALAPRSACAGRAAERDAGRAGAGPPSRASCPGSSASRRAWVWGESGFALIVSAFFQDGWRARRSAAALAPAKLGIRPSAPGKRDTPSRSIDRQTSWRTWSFVRIGRSILPESRPRWPSQPAHAARACVEARRRRPEAPPVAAAGGSRGRSARPPAGHRARAPADGLGPLGADRGPHGRHPVRVLLPLLVPGGGGGDRERARSGGALLVSNHSGALPPDAAMITKAIREEHPHGRPLNITVEHFFKGYPGFSMLIPKIGCVAAHPANVHRLLFDEEQLVLVFPEGRKGTEKLYKDRYRLRRFGRGGFVEAAMRAEAPIVPVCVVGAEEAAPVFAQLGLLKRLTGLLYFPITPTFPHFGLLGMLGYLPAKFKHPLPRADPLRRGGPLRGQGAGADDGPRGARADPGEPLGHARQAQVGLVRLMPSRRILVTGLSTYWGGRLAQALEGDPASRGDHGRGQRGAGRRARADRVRQGRRPARAAAEGGRGGRDRHRRRHEAGGRLDHHHARQGPREQRHRDDEHPGGVQRRDSPVRKFVFKSSAHYYGCRAGRPGVLRRDDGPTAPAADPDRARHPRGRGVGQRVRREEPGRLGDASCASRTSSARTSGRRTSGSSRCRPCR